MHIRRCHVTTPPPDWIENPDEQDLATVARRLDKSRRWLETQLAEDDRRPPSEQRLQHHHFMGRERRWEEIEYQALRRALIAVSGERKRRPASGSSSVTASGTS